MQASTSTSRPFSSLWGILVFWIFLSTPLVHAEEFDELSNATPPSEEAENFNPSPYTQYGEFDDAEEEEENALFFQYGRFFGVSLGAGFQGATGNRGLLWSGGFPVVDLRLHAWFDFQMALQIQFYAASHSYSLLNNGDTESLDVGFNRLGLDIKYYFDTTHSSAAITFASPYLLVGIGSFNKTEKNLTSNLSDRDSTFGLTGGLGLEFPIKFKKSYFNIEGKFHFPSFKDRVQETTNLSDRKGFFYTTTASILFTW